MSLPIVFSQTLAAGAATGVSASQSPGSGAILINGTKATGGVATLDVQRRIVIASGGNDSGITFTINGTNQSGAPISDTVTGANIGSVQSNQDFLTVTSVSHTGSVAGTVTVGTNGVGSSPWQILNRGGNLNISVELRSGAANFTIEYTYDDPNILPGTGGLNQSGLPYAFPFADNVIVGASATIQNFLTNPVFAVRLTTNSGTGTLVFRGIVFESPDA